MNNKALYPSAIKTRMVLPLISGKIFFWSFLGVIVACFFSINIKFGFAALLLGSYIAIVLPRPYLSLLILVGLIPFPVQILGTLTITLIMGLITAIVAISYFLVKGLRWHYDPLHILVGGIVFIFSISVIFGMSYSQEQAYLSNVTELRLYYTVAVLYFLTFSLVSNIHQVKRIVWIIVISCSIHAMINILQAKFQFTIPGVEILLPFEQTDFSAFNDIPRVHGTALHPITSAIMLQVGFFLSLFLLMAEKSFILRFFLILITFLIIPWGWSFTFARTSMIGILGTIPYIIIKLRHKISKKTVPVVLGVIFLGLTLFPFVVGIWGDSPIVNRFLTIFDSFEQNKTIHFKIDHIDASLKIFQDYPLFGMGFGNYRLNYVKYLRPDALKEWHPTNSTEITYLDLLTEQGSVGLLLFLLILYFTFSNLRQAIKWYSQKGDGDTATMIMGLSVALWSIIICYLGFDGATFKYTWIFIGLSAAIKRTTVNMSKLC